MKKIIFILALAIFSFLTGCDNNEFLEKIGLKQRITNVIQIRNEIAYLPNSDEPFTGKHEIFYPSGQKKYEINYKEGKRNGLSTRWYENGQKNEEGNYINGLTNGIYTVWSENGQKGYEGNLIDGKRNGLSTWWDKHGQKSDEGNYIDGNLIK